MTTIKVVLDSRRRSDGQAQIIFRSGDEKYGTGLYAVRLVNGIAVEGKHVGIVNARIASWVDEIEKAMLRGLAFRSACETTSNEHGIYYLIPVYKEFMETKKGGTLGIYHDGLVALEAYGKSKIALDSITKQWLLAFDRWMEEKRGLATNTRSMRLRCVRAAINYAIDQGYTTNYPFRQFQIKNEETRKRCLTRDQLVALRDYQCEPWQEQYRDVFMLMFYLCGINTVDLWGLTNDSYKDGRITYRRQKTGKQYDIKVEPEAAAIIDKYRGKKKLLSMAESVTHTTFGHNLACCLQALGDYKRVGLGGKKVVDRILPEGTSAYWARHTMATMMYEIGIPVDVIGQALGHSNDSHATTMIYIKQPQSKVDEANRKLLDYIK